MEVRILGRPLSIDVGHVFPCLEVLGKGVQQTVFGLIDLGHPEDVVDIGDDGHALRRDEIRRRVTGVGPFHVQVQQLYMLRLVAGRQSSTVQLEEGVEVSLLCRLVWQLDGLRPSCSRYTATDGIGRDLDVWDKIHRHLDVGLLYNIYGPREVPGILLLVRRQLVDVYVDEEVVS